MAGHSKWANIRHRKAGQDARRGKVFTRIIRELTVAARLGGANPADNPRLRAAMDKALAANMTRDTMARAIARGTGTAESENLQEVMYEGYGPGGVAILCETLTDNRNRTVAAVRHGFSKFGGSLGTHGSVGWMFRRTGVISFAASVNEERLLEVALAAGADDIVINADGSIDVLTTLEQFAATGDALQAARLVPLRTELTMQATTEVKLDLPLARKLLALLEHLEELDDVQNVHSNADIADEIAQHL